MMRLIPWLEAVVAVALALAGSFAIILFFPNLWAKSQLAPNVFIYVGFYILKCGITYRLHGKREWAAILYVLELLVLAALMLYDACSAVRQCDWLFNLFVFGLDWCVVPTATFVFDLAVLGAKPSPRLLIWRSLLEILVVRPCWQVVAGVIFGFVLTWLGVWPFVGA